MNRLAFTTLFLATAVAASACNNRPTTAQTSAACCDAVDSLMITAIAEMRFPAAAISLGNADAVVKSTGYGSFTYDDTTPVSDTSRFDLASLTKVVATTTAIMLLYERGLVDIEAPVAKYIPEFGSHGKDRVTVRNLLQHRGGLAPFRRFYLDGGATPETVLRAVLYDSLAYEPDSQEVYSDLGFITLGHLVEKVSGRDLNSFTRNNIFKPLGMIRTGFRVAGDVATFIVPTEIDSTFRQRLVQGEVHDENAYVLGGAAGHAGLFSTAADLARFCRMLAGKGLLDGHRFLESETIQLFTDRDLFRVGHRGFGWDFKSLEGYSSAGERFGPRSFGHTGFTGTSIWVDPDARVFAVLLTNRVYPTRANRGHIDVRPAFADRAYELASRH
jgi:CubicO group peptidase (beta-lactamase class C family)